MADQTLNELDDETLSVDTNGTRILSGGRLFRAFTAAESRDFVRPIFESGLVDELNRRGLIARTWISDQQFEGYETVVEHELISPLTLPFEWSFSMLQDAALAFLELVEVAARYGYYLKDSHSYNFVWKEGRPLWVDFGSFERMNTEFGDFFSLQFFVKYFYEPLVMWSRFGSFFGAAMLEDRSESAILGTDAFWRLVYPWVRLIPRHWLVQIAHAVESCRRLAGIRDIAARKKSRAVLIGGMILKKLLYRDTGKLCRKWKRKIHRIPFPKEWGQWSNYHTKLGNVEHYPRFQRIMKILDSLNCRSVLELAGNSGSFSLLLAQHGVGGRIICTDCDVQAVDLLYQTIRNGKVPQVSPAWLDIRYPRIMYGVERPQKRFRSEAVLALAVTHHLILSQKLPLSQVLKIIGSYATNYVLIEFMPLGLYDGKNTTPIPEWYTVDWFRREFALKFISVCEIVLEENRILFVGRIRQNDRQDDKNV